MADVYKATEGFPRHELYGLTSQLRRAACSVVSNIAEGQGRLTYGEWRQPLSHARGSLYEVQAQVLASERLNLIKENSVLQLQKRIRAAGRELAGLIAWIRKREAQSKRRRTMDSRTTDN